VKALDSKIEANLLEAAGNWIYSNGRYFNVAASTMAFKLSHL
jgi:hypothetical protein